MDVETSPSPGFCHGDKASAIDMILRADGAARQDKISRLMKDAHYECSQAAAFLLGVVRPGQWGNADAAHLATERAMAIFAEIEAVKCGAPL